ncbi:MAG: hypothetical protein Q7T30_03330, partial [Planctomycetota bacterium]|nr:hypothetical protein [Planctomycetota bacterium]
MRSMHGVVSVGIVIATTQFLPAQGYGNGSSGALAPTSDITLDTTANSGVFQFTSIAIPTGVTVHLVGSNPARLLCQGAVTIAGVLEGDGQGSRWVGSSHVNGHVGGPGGHAGGAWQQNGAGPGGGGAGIGIYPAIWGGSASHATVGVITNPFVPASPTYGSALPFDVNGGSGGGGAGMGHMSCFGPPASGGGGVIVILAGGSIDVTGTVRA